MQFIDNLKKEEYQKFVNNHQKSHFLQTYGWGTFCEKVKGQKAHYLGLKKDNKLVAATLLLERKTPIGYSYGYCPRGFILDYENKDLLKEFTDYLKQYMKDNKYIYIKVDPDIKYQDIDENANPLKDGFNNYELFTYFKSLGYIHKGFNKLYENNQPRYTFRINFKKTWDEIESNMSRSFTRSVKKSYDYNLIIDNESIPKELCRLSEYNSLKDNFNTKNLKYYEELTTNLKDHIKYYNASIEPKKYLKTIDEKIISLKNELETSKKKEKEINDKISRLEKEKDIFNNYKEDKIIICSLLCTYTNNRAWSFLIGNDDLGNTTCAIARVYYEAIKDAYNKKYDFFDLFGTPGDPNTNYKNLAKLHDFKRKFGDEYTEFIGEFDLVNKKFLYHILPILLKVYRFFKKKK